MFLFSVWGLRWCNYRCESVCFPFLKWANRTEKANRILTGIPKDTGCWVGTYSDMDMDMICDMIDLQYRFTVHGILDFDIVSSTLSPQIRTLEIRQYQSHFCSKQCLLYALDNTLLGNWQYGKMILRYGDTVDTVC